MMDRFQRDWALFRANECSIKGAWNISRNHKAIRGNGQAMSTHHMLLLPGDGIGPEIMEQALKVLHVLVANGDLEAAAEAMHLTVTVDKGHGDNERCVHATSARLTVPDSVGSSS